MISSRNIVLIIIKTHIYSRGHFESNEEELGTPELLYKLDL